MRRFLKKEHSGERPFAPYPEENSGHIMTKVSWRLLPLLFICYIIAYIDRINVGFAKLQLREVLGVDENIFSSIYGLGAGLFFIGYFLFEVPSNLILQRMGARLWIARIMIIWGIVASCMMFINNTTQFYLMRFLLGVSEAGFYPGVILYLTYWYPARERARTVALFATGAVLAGIVGSPLSGIILDLNGMAGLEGWQWLFLLEGIPAVLLGLVVLFFLPDSPNKSHWLTSSEKDWLCNRIKEETARDKEQIHFRLSKALTSRRLWLLCGVYFLLNVGGYGYELWMPTIIKGFSGISNTAVGWINAIPYVVAAMAMLIVGHHSDRTGERRWHVAIAAFISAIGFAFSAYFHNPFIAMIALTIAFAALKATVGPFWVLGTAFLSGTAAAGGIAFINSVGNLGGFVGPTLVGIIKDRTTDNAMALLLLAVALLCMGLLVLFIRKNPFMKKPPSENIL